MEDLIEFHLKLRDRRTGEKLIRVFYAVNLKDIKEVQGDRYEILEAEPCDRHLIEIVHKDQERVSSD